MKWSPELDEVIRKRYPLEGSSIAKELKVQPHVLRVRANRLGVKYVGKRKNWTGNLFGKKG